VVSPIHHSTPYLVFPNRPLVSPGAPTSALFPYTTLFRSQEINRASIFFTCPSIYNYPVMKYFEALAAKSLLLAPTFPELEDLGFQPGKHFVSIDATNFQEKASYYLLKDKERQKITEQGYRFIHQTHTVQKRVKELVKTMENIIRS